MLKKLRLFIIIFILVLIFLPGFAKLQELKQKYRETRIEMLLMKNENAMLRQKIAQLRNNPDSLEMVAREKMGVVKKGETIVKIVHEDEETNVAQNATATNITKR